jgi:hypothetical protein
VIENQRSRQSADTIKLLKISRPESGVAIRLDQVPHLRSTAIASNAAVAVSRAKKTAIVIVIARMKRLKSTRAESAGAPVPGSIAKNRTARLSSGRTSGAAPELKP